MSANLLLLTSAVELVVFPWCYGTCIVPGNLLQPINSVLFTLAIQLLNKNERRLGTSYENRICQNPTCQNFAIYFILEICHML